MSTLLLVSLINTSNLHCSTQRPAAAFGAGVVTGAAALAVAIVGRKAATAARVGQGHPLKHRLLHLASAVLQRKYPVEAMSTYLNGFHMYADEVGRQVEATHFCIHLRHDLHQCVIFDRNAADARLIGIEYSPVDRDRVHHYRRTVPQLQRR